MSSIVASVIHASDIHFGSCLSENPGRPPLEMKFPWWSVAPYIRAMLNKSCAGHDTAIVTNLRKNLRSMLMYYETVNNERDNFDLYIISGDLSTYPTLESYSFLAQYLFSGNFNDPDPDEINLGLNAEQVILVQGNHDKLGRNNVSMLEKILPRDTYCYPPRNSYSFISKYINDMEFLFLVIDSNCYAPMEPAPTSFPLTFAKGEISDAMANEIKTNISLLKTGARVDRAQLSNYVNAQKIVILHHPARSPKEVRENLRETVFPHFCVNIESLFEILSQENFIVLHGHLHNADSYKVKGLYCFDCGSTSQYMGKEATNSINVINFYSSGSFNVDTWKWNGLMFTLTRDDSICY